MKVDNNIDLSGQLSIRPRVSIIIPVLNEAALVTQALEALSVLRARGAEIIVVDGGSRDGTAELAQASGLADAVLCTGRGRAVQMNAGASGATGDVLLFLHVDTRLPEGADQLIVTALGAPPHVGGWEGGWGRFDLRIEGCHWLLVMVAQLMNLRSRLSGICTGDQALFIARSLFQRSGGFPEQPLMEDIALSRILKRHSAPACLRAKVTTSGRRWERQGVLRTILLMWRLRLAYYLGVSPQRLARRYERQR